MECSTQLPYTRHHGSLAGILRSTLHFSASMNYTLVSPRVAPTTSLQKEKSMRHWSRCLRDHHLTRLHWHRCHLGHRLTRLHWHRCHLDHHLTRLPAPPRRRMVDANAVDLRHVADRDLHYGQPLLPGHVRTIIISSQSIHAVLVYLTSQTSVMMEHSLS